MIPGCCAKYQPSKNSPKTYSSTTTVAQQTPRSFRMRHCGKEAKSGMADKSPWTGCVFVQTDFRCFDHAYWYISSGWCGILVVCNSLSTFRELRSRPILGKLARSGIAESLSVLRTLSRIPSTTVTVLGTNRLNICMIRITVLLSCRKLKFRFTHSVHLQSKKETSPICAL